MFVFRLFDTALGIFLIFLLGIRGLFFSQATAHPCLFGLKVCIVQGSSDVWIGKDVNNWINCRIAIIKPETQVHGFRRYNIVCNAIYPVQ
jgi:hypothetical protein